MALGAAVVSKDLSKAQKACLSLISFLLTFVSRSNFGCLLNLLKLL